MRILGNEARIQKEYCFIIFSFQFDLFYREEERKREEERIRREQELLEKQRLERQRAEEQQRLLAEKKAAEEKELAEKLKKENAEKLKSAGGTQTPNKPVQTGTSAQPITNRPIPKVPNDYFHPDYIEIIQGHAMKVSLLLELVFSFFIHTAREPLGLLWKLGTISFDIMTIINLR